MTRVTFHRVLRISALTVLLLGGSDGSTAGPIVGATDDGVDLTSLAVCFAPGLTANDRATVLQEAGIGDASLKSTGVSGWYLLNLPSSLEDALSVRDHVHRLLDSLRLEFATPVLRGPDDRWTVVMPTILLRFEPDYRATAESLLTWMTPWAEEVRASFGDMPGAFALRGGFRNGFDVLAEAGRLAADPRIAWAEPDMQFSARKELIPDDPGFGALWGLVNSGQLAGVPGMDMDADLAWEITTGSAGVKVLILDDGVQLDHPDLNVDAGMDFTTDAGGGGPVNECDTHGTLVAGCVSAHIDNGLGTVGIAPVSPVLAARVAISDVPCDGTGTVTSSWVVDALAWGVAQGARVSNFSWSIGESSAVTDAYLVARQSGMLHFASAGNDSDPLAVVYPASLPTVNAIAALGPSGALALFSNHGPDVALAAPGVSIYTTDRTGADGASPDDYVSANGTSFASPYTAGVAALVLSVEPSLTVDELEQKLYCSARDLGTAGHDNDYGHGFVNAYRAVVAPLGVDSDGDGTDDPCDNCRAEANTDQADNDMDGIGNVCDVCPDDSLDDVDGDGHCADVDNCPFVYNPGQEDGDGDGIGDSCACNEASYELDGAAANDLFGYRMASAGDVNDDGRNDFIVGAPKNDGAGTDNGRAYIFSGEHGELLFTIDGTNEDDRLGRSVAGAGDINGDGYDDVLVTAFLNDGGGNNSGQGYVMLGGPAPPVVNLSAADAHFGITGAPGEQLGTAAAVVPDIDGDGIRDLLIAACFTGNGQAYLHSGASGALIRDFVGQASGDRFGWSVSAAGDVDGDGLQDVIIGADQANGAAGRAYIYGAASGDLRFMLTGEAAGDLFGNSVAGFGDLNEDGFDDVIVGAPLNDALGLDAGRAYIFLGGPVGFPVVRSAADADVILDGGASGDFFGRYVARAADINGDGADDIVIGATGQGTTGRAYIYSGSSGTELLSFGGDAAGDEFGVGIDARTDLNGDGSADLVVGAFNSDPNGTSSGKVSVYYLGDVDGDGLQVMCDNCPQGYNPGQDAAVFGQTVLASARDTFSWASSVHAEWVRGDLAEVLTYATEQSGAVVAATTLQDATLPETGEGLYYLLRLGGSCQAASWQSSTGAELERDLALP